MQNNTRKLIIRFNNGQVRNYTEVMSVYSNSQVIYFWHENGKTRTEFKMKDVEHYILKSKGW